MHPLVAQVPFVASDPIWWLWILVALGFLGVIVYLVSHIGPGGPWARR